MPILRKTWHQPYTAELLARTSDTAACMRVYLYLIKMALLSHPTNPWTVLASYGGGVVGTDDNWTSSDVLGRGPNDTTVGSWILLQAPGTSTVYLYLEWTGNLDYQVNVWVTTEKPDLSNLSTVKGLVLGGPKCGQDSWTLLVSTGTAVNSMSAVVADDGSFTIMHTLGLNQIGAGDRWSSVKEYDVLWFNRSEDVNPLDPYGFTLFCTNDTSNALVEVDTTAWRDVRSIHPDGTQIVCTIGITATIYDSYFVDLQSTVCDDFMRNWRPLVMPMRIYATTPGKESYKGVVSDMWWGTKETPRFGQPGFEGEEMVVMQKGILWVPCSEPYRW